MPFGFNKNKKGKPFMGLASKLKQEVVSSLGVTTPHVGTGTSGTAPQSGYGAASTPGQQGGFVGGYGAGIPPVNPNQSSPYQQNQQSYGQASPYGQASSSQQQYGTKPGGSNPYSPAYGAQQPNTYGQHQQHQQQPFAYRQSAPPSMPPQYGSATHGSSQYPSAPSSQYGQHGQHQQPGMPGMMPGMMPQQQQGMMPPQQNTMKTTGNNEAILATKLQKIIAANNLQTFYDATRFQQVMQKVMTINFDAIASQWKISREIATDLVSLALYDIVFYCDDSGSMAFGDNGERVDDLKFILNRVAEIATMFDDDGIVVRFMNSRTEGNGIKSAAEVNALIGKISFNGMTPLGSELDRKIIQPMVLSQAMSGSMMKPVMVIAITDGEPSESKDILTNVIRNAKDSLARTRYGPGAFAIQIAQVGTDRKAQEFLEKLDRDPIVGRMIDCTSNFEMEQMEYSRKGINLTPDQWLVKMCLGAIDPEYDEGDE